MHVMMISGVLMTCQQPSNRSVGHTHHLPVCACARYKRQQCSASPTTNCTKKAVTKTIGKRKEKKRKEEKKGKKQKKERKEKKRKEKKRKEKKRKEKKRKEKKREEKRRKENAFRRQFNEREANCYTGLTRKISCTST